MPIGPPADDGTLLRPHGLPGDGGSGVGVQFGAAHEEVFSGCAAVASLATAGTSRPAREGGLNEGPIGRPL